MKIQNKCICITGASGFLSSHIIVLLLQNNNIVHTTTRNKQLFEDKYLIYIQNIVHDKIENLHIFEINNYNFKEALNNCEYLIHCASPVILKPFETDDDNYKYIVEPSLKYTEHLLNSVSIESNIKKVIFTSSTCCIYNGKQEIYENTDWADETINDPYSVSKIVSEKKAWEIYFKQEGNNKNKPH